ncbi:hypothetical protein CROQUDRAFT_653585 [Cronartium quercuum f. sp. fusiforme G11]|uniref:Palmitoyltransferase n=1 Tax=Cronartium quercuum f. sp. fusiforme G11 TaxID=708437 RepID=A0A9P6NLX2_9BASI|nr:hypothetical protein CROQUDRAFT_653585 [Cronartium quercuum f. sp. fusiforme G11]
MTHSNSNANSHSHSDSINVIVNPIHQNLQSHSHSQTESLIIKLSPSSNNQTLSSNLPLTIQPQSSINPIPIPLSPSSDACTLKFETDKTHSITPRSQPIPPPQKSNSLRSVSLRSPTTGRPVRNAELHPGKNRFFCRGRLVGSGDNCLPLILSSCCAIGLPSAFLVTNAKWLCSGSFAKDGQDDFEHRSQSAVMGGRAMIAIYCYIFMIMLSSMFMTSWTDPGIIPRELDPEPELEWVNEPGEDSEASEALQMKSTQIGEPQPKSRWIEIGDHSILTKWCQTCQTYRPPRTSHCKLCDNCVEQSDHHCTFLNNCIGRRNYFTFLVFLGSTTALVFLTISISLAHIIAGPRDASFVIGSYVVFGLTILIGGPVIGLAIFHCRLVLRNTTTIETLRTKGLGVENDETRLHSLGSVWENCIHVGCRPGRPLSWIRPTAHATCDLRS